MVLHPTSQNLVSVHDCDRIYKRTRYNYSNSVDSKSINSDVILNRFSNCDLDGVNIPPLKSRYRRRNKNIPMNVFFNTIGICQSIFSTFYSVIVHV